MIKKCLVCGASEHIKTFNDKAVSHGLCNSPYCLRAFVIHGIEGVTAREINNIISECKKERLVSKIRERLESCCYSDGLTRSIHKPAGHTCVYSGSLLRGVS